MKRSRNSSTEKPSKKSFSSKVSWLTSWSRPAALFAAFVFPSVVPFLYAQPASTESPSESSPAVTGQPVQTSPQTPAHCDSNRPYLIDDGQGHRMPVIYGASLMGDYVITATNKDTDEVVALQFLAPEEYLRMAEVLRAFAERCTGPCEEAKRHFTLGKLYSHVEPIQGHVYVMDLWPERTFNAVYGGELVKDGLEDNRAHAAELMEKTIEIAGLARVLLEMDYVHLDIYGDTIFVKDDGSLLLASIEEIFPLNSEDQINQMLELISQLPYTTEVLLTDLPHLRLVDDEKADALLNSRLQTIVQKARSGDYLKEAQGEGLKQRALSAVDSLIADLNVAREMVTVPTGQSH